MSNDKLMHCLYIKCILEKTIVANLQKLVTYTIINNMQSNIDAVCGAFGYPVNIDVRMDELDSLKNY